MPPATHHETNMPQTPQSDDLRQTISSMLVEVGITAEELHDMLFGRGQEMDVSTPELSLSTDQLMSEGTWADRQLSDHHLETVALHVDIRSALNAIDSGAIPEAAEALTALLGEEVIAGSNELQVKRKFLDFQKGLKAFLAALSFQQLLAVTLALAAKTAPNLVPTFSDFRNRPQERKQLEHFVLTQVTDPTPPAVAALALAGMAMTITPMQGMEFAQPLRQFAIGLDMPKLEQVRSQLETIVEREPQRTSTSLPENDSGKDKDKNKDGIPDKLQTRNTPPRAQNPLAPNSQQQQQEAQQSQQQQQPEGATPPGPERKPKMSNLYGRTKSGSGRKAREAAEKEASDKEAAAAASNTATVQEEAKPQQRAVSGGKVEALIAQRSAEALQRQGMRDYQRDRADGVMGNGTTPVRKPESQQPDGQAAASTRPAKSQSSKSDKQAKPEAKPNPEAKPETKAVEQPNPGKMPEAAPLDMVKVTTPPLQVNTPTMPKLADMLPADMLKGFAGLKAQDFSAEELGSTKASIVKDDPLSIKAKPTPQIER